MSSRMSLAAAAVIAVGLAACTKSAPAPRAPRSAASLQAEAALQAGDFPAAEASAREALGQDPRDAQAAAIRAVAAYQAALSHLRDEFMGVIDSAGASTGFDHARMRAALERTRSALADVDASLAVAGQDPAFALPLCLACWERDWNHSGEIDRSDRLLFQIEVDADGEEIPADDPRRKPRFRFDLGDVYWARAMVSFQGALLDLLLAYRWTDLDALVFGSPSGQMTKLVIRMEQPARVQAARAAILAGLDHADRARREYLAETDDEDEWVPSPRQLDHPLPLPADEALYETWAGVLGDLRLLIERKELISVAEVAQLGDDVWERPPGGFVDVGLMLSKPKDIVFDFTELEALGQDYEQNIEAILASILGEYYVREGKPTAMIRRLARMKSEVERGEESLERKLRYLLWLN